MNDKQLIANVTSLRRSELLQSMLNVGKDINTACGYPTFITMSDYKQMFAREGSAKRVVNILPEGSWATSPEVLEDDTAKETKFEVEWKALDKKNRVNHYLQRIDSLSGIGRYGVLLLGLSDGLELSEPVTGINPLTGEKQGDAKLSLLFLRPFDESLVEIKRKELDVSSPRLGFPVEYSIKFDDSSQLDSQQSVTKVVHWTRIIHVADNRETSEIYGVPRMKGVYNRLLDIRKVLSGSGEMFWKGAFPGYSFEINSDVKDPNMDTDSIRKEFEKYSQGLQRYIALEGVTAKSLEVQVADPGPHLKSQWEYISITLGVPLRILMGSEQAKLASTQDKETWNDRLSSRQTKYVGPMIITPFVDRMIALGVLPTVEDFIIKWPDLNTPSDKDQAEVGKIRTDALAAYINSSADSLIPPKEFLMIILGMSEEQATVIEKAALKWGDLKAEPAEPAEPVTSEDDDDE